MSNNEIRSEVDENEVDEVIDENEVDETQDGGIDNLNFENPETCPNCGHFVGGDTTCPNCGAILGDDEDELNVFEEN